MRLVIAAMAVSALACRDERPVSAREMPGVYTIRTDEFVDTLTLAPDGSFRHQLWEGTTLAVSEQGHWTASSYPDGQAAVDLSPISPIHHRAARGSLRPGFWLARVGRTRSGEPILMVEEDIGLFFRRANTSH
jgi:hypothetical protein